MTQIKKAKGLNKKFNNPVDEKRLTILDFCFVLQDGQTIPVKDWLKHTNRVTTYCGLSKLNHTKGVYALYYDEYAGYRGIMKDETSNEVSYSSIEKGAVPKVYLFFNQEAYSAHCKNYNEYWNWVKKRNEARYKGNQEHGKGYDAKNMMHTIRLLQMAKELFETGKLNVERSNRNELLSIKSGNKAYGELLVYAEQLMHDIDVAVTTSSLPILPDEERAKKILVAMREQLYM